MLVQIALVLSAVFAVASLAIDFGYATLTQVQMQNAADAAALEGIRFRNAVADDGFASDCARRLAARDIVTWTFDDDFNAATGDPHAFGAGPVIEFDAGVGDLEALRGMRPGTPPVYKPTLELNQAGNVVHGDMVSGAFTWNAAPPPDEDDGYLRLDFVANPAVPLPGASGFTACPDAPPALWPVSGSGPLLSDSDQAFLARLRRTTDNAGLDSVASVSSSGPPLPLLWGSGTTMHGDADGTYSPRRDGLTVRASAIAQARPAMRVGTTAGPYPGGLPFALDRTLVETLGVTPLAAQLEATGLITVGGAVVGQFVAAPRAIHTVGTPLPPPAPFVCDPAAASNELSGFGAVTMPIGATATPRVVAFARLALAWPDCARAPAALELSLGTGLVAAGNASALVVEGLFGALTPDDRRSILTATAQLATAHIALLAPVLAR